MIPIVEDFVQRFGLDDFIIVADSGLMNKSNIALSESGSHKYIVGARIKMNPRQQNDGYCHWKNRTGNLMKPKKAQPG